MEPLELSVVIPAYREADALRRLLPVLIPIIQGLSACSEVIVVDSLEPLDDTFPVCTENGVHHIHRMGGNTYGDAVRTGIQSSAGQYVLLMDADGSHNPNDIERLWSVRNESDIVIGSRYVLGGGTENPTVLIWMSRVVNYLYEFAFSLPVSDVSNSFRLYRGAQLRSVELVSTNFDIVEEILIRLAFGPTRSTISEVPVTFERRKAGKSKRNLPAFMLSYVASIARLRKFRATELRRVKLGM